MCVCAYGRGKFFICSLHNVLTFLQYEYSSAPPAGQPENDATARSTYLRISAHFKVTLTRTQVVSTRGVRRTSAPAPMGYILSRRRRGDVREVDQSVEVSTVRVSSCGVLTFYSQRRICFQRPM